MYGNNRVSVDSYLDVRYLDVEYGINTIVEEVQQRVVWTERRRIVDGATTSTEQQKK